MTSERLTIGSGGLSPVRGREASCHARTQSSTRPPYHPTSNSQKRDSPIELIQGTFLTSFDIDSLVA